MMGDGDPERIPGAQGHTVEKGGDALLYLLEGLAIGAMILGWWVVT